MLFKLLLEMNLKCIGGEECMSKKKSKIPKMFYGKTAEKNRTINLQFRVTEEELKQIEKRQAEVGILNRSS